MNSQCTAPGKLVLWGEYAVLAGAPAVAMAIDRIASVSFASGQGRRWHIRTPGLQQNPLQTSVPALIIGSPPSSNAPDALLWHVLNALKGAVNELPPGGALTLDSTPFQHQGSKLGLGSSAAVCTALTGLLRRLTRSEPDFETAYIAHRSAQGGRGSGLDVAAAFYGGLVCLTANPDDPWQAPPVVAYAWPVALHWQGFWSAQAAATTAHINRFDQWLANTRDRRPLDALIACSQRLAEGLELQAMAGYIQALRQFDQAAKLGIYTPLHDELHNLAARHDVLYKPCGAGGGDMGIAMSNNPQELAAFTQAATQSAATNAAQPLDLRLADHGIQIRP